MYTKLKYTHANTLHMIQIICLSSKHCCLLWAVRQKYSMSCSISIFAKIWEKKSPKTYYTVGEITHELIIHVTYSELFGKVSMVENTFQCINLLRNGLIAMEKCIKIFLLFELQKVKHTKFQRWCQNMVCCYQIYIYKKVLVVHSLTKNG